MVLASLRFGLRLLYSSPFSKFGQHFPYLSCAAHENELRLAKA